MNPKDAAQNFIACHLDVGAAEDELAQSKQHQAEALDVLNTALARSA